jgi:CheY-like chemotaxis protein
LVLVVEDEILVRVAIVDYLTEHGCGVLEAASGEEALTFVNGHDQQFDVLFTDIRLGGPLNGWDVAEIFRDHFPDIRVLYASGFSIQPSRDVPESVFFEKPYRPEEILEACRRWTSRNEANVSTRPSASGKHAEK